MELLAYVVMISEIIETVPNGNLAEHWSSQMQKDES